MSTCPCCGAPTRKCKKCGHHEYEQPEPIYIPYPSYPSPTTTPWYWESPKWTYTSDGTTATITNTTLSAAETNALKTETLTTIREAIESLASK